MHGQPIIKIIFTVRSSTKARLSTQYRRLLDIYRLKVALSFNVSIYGVNRESNNCGVQAKDSSVARQHCAQIYSKLLTLPRSKVLFSLESVSKTYSPVAR